jgi:hypothetical protein
MSVPPHTAFVHIILGIGHFDAEIPTNRKGVMANVGASPNDPVFINHHTMVDCILEEWLKKHPDAKYPEGVPSTKVGHRGDDYIVPFFPLVKHSDVFKSGDYLGYWCDISAVLLLKPTQWIVFIALACFSFALNDFN